MQQINNYFFFTSLLKEFSKKFSKSVKFNVFEAKNLTFGHLATNIIPLLAAANHKSLEEVSESIQSFFQNLNESWIAKTTVINNRFFNIFFSNHSLSINTLNVIKNKHKYGQGQPKKCLYNLELVSANPTGRLHVGHARNAVIGDINVRILKFSGYQVVTEYYTNDGGQQMRILALTVFINYLKCCGIEKALPQDCYQGDHYQPVAAAIYAKYGTKFVKDKYTNMGLESASTEAIFKKHGLDYFLNLIKQDLKNLGVTIDYYASEQIMIDSGALNTVVRKLQQNNAAYEKDGALWIASSQYGDDKDRVIIKSDGSYTYLLPDLTYHYQKWLRTAPGIIVDFWGWDHHGYIARMRAGLKFLACDDSHFEVNLIAMVRILHGDIEVKMSKRRNQAIWLHELIAAVGAPILRYMLASKMANSKMELDIDKLREQNMQNHYFYVQYAVVRCNAVLKQSHELGFAVADLSDPATIAYSASEISLINKISLFSFTVQQAAIKRHPHMITDYLYDLARRFHQYYNTTRIIEKNNPDIVRSRLQLIAAVRQVLINALNLIGIEPLNKM